MGETHEALRSSRARSGYSQEDAAAALGVSRAMVSYWEGGSRTPNDRQVAALARLYGVQPVDLSGRRGAKQREGGLTAACHERQAGDLAGLLLRSDTRVGSEAVPGIREFVRFLDSYARLAGLLGASVRGMTLSPFKYRAKFTQKDDIRRKAEEARSVLGLGTGPISDLDPVCEMLGITVYRAPLSGDLSRVPSGAFLNHPEVGFSILVNLDMTPGRRRFTVAHELAHALFHSHETKRVVSLGRNPRENFADAFAGEFLMPSEGVRRFVEEAGMQPRISDPADAVCIQRYFRVSWPTALVRLRQMNTITQDTYDVFKAEIRPVSLARSLGYSIHPEEYAQDPDRWTRHRFPRPFLRMLSEATDKDVISRPTAASLAGLALPELLRILGEPSCGEDETSDLDAEFSEFEDSGVV